MASREHDLHEFLRRNRIDDGTWSKAAVPWDLLKGVRKAYEARHPELEDSAAFLARRLQRHPAVHSVRWRVKSADHVLEKIIRKRAEGREKYLQLTAENYGDVMTDLVGLRALHLFKGDWESVHAFITEDWNLAEDPVAYVRQGDDTSSLDGHGVRVECHQKGYRSTHYIVRTQPLKSVVLAELQVRTIFEEGWSEIDHRVRYPNFTDHPLVELFLGNFNRLAGSADEMGSFVKALVAEVDRYEKNLLTLRESEEAKIAKMQETVARLREAEAKNERAQGELSSLSKQLDSLKAGNHQAGGLMLSNEADAVWRSLRGPTHLTNSTERGALANTLLGILAANAAATSPKK